MNNQMTPGPDRPEQTIDSPAPSNDNSTPRGTKPRRTRRSKRRREPTDGEPSAGDPPSDAGVGFGAGVIPPEGSGGKTSRKKKAARRKAAKKKGSASASPKADAPRPEASRPEASVADAPVADARGSKTTGSTPSTGEEPEGGGGRKKRSRRRKKAASPEREQDDSKAGTEPAGEETSATGERGGDEAQKRRRRGRRGGRRRRKKSSVDEDAVEVDVLPGDENDLAELPEGGSSRGGTKKQRPRSSRKGEADEGESDSKKSAGKKAKGRKKDSTDKADDKKAKKKASKKKRAAKDADSKDDSKKRTSKRKASKKKAKSSEPEKSPEELAAEEEAARTKIILVNAIDPEEKRVAVVENERITDLLMTSDSQKSLVNDIYRGRVVNLEPAIGAAFIDFGQGRNGFLHTSDVLAIYGEKGFTLDQLLTSKVEPEEWDEAPSQPSIGEEVADVEDALEEDAKSKKDGDHGRAKSRQRRRGRERRPISDLLRVGDQVVVQVTKDAIGDKGPTLTTYISIPGRYLVLMPSMARTGVSRKIPDDKERRRLKRILSSIQPPEDMGVIVRTAGIGKTKKDLKRDLDYLLGVWESFGKRLGKGRGPAPLYQESNVAIRTLRDLFGPTTKEVVVDDPVVHEELIEFAEKLMPEQIDRVRLYDAERPIFHQYGIEQDYEKIFSRRVELPSGGSIVFDQAEALVAIDVNSGRTRTNSFDFEEIALKTNLEAVPEIARQIRLRDLGGILVCDFIDMTKGSSNRTVERALRTAMADDRARSKLGRISQFGLLELTRQRLGPGTHKKVFQACPRCRGTGRIRTVQSRAQAILRRLGSALTQKGFTTVEARAHPEVVDYIKEHLWDYTRALEHRFEKEIKLTSVPDQPEDSVLRYLRADGREVRPGGRRKR